MLFSNREFRSLGRNEVPADFKSLNRGETSSFKICVEKLDVGDAAVISLSLNPAFKKPIWQFEGMLAGSKVTAGDDFEF